MTDSKLQQADDLVHVADHVATVTGQRRSIIVHPDGTLGVHSDRFITERGLSTCEVLYVAEVGK